MNIRSVARLALILILGGCISFSIGCTTAKTVGHAMTNAVEITNDHSEVNLTEQVENTAAALNAYQYEDDEAKAWINKSWALLYKIYKTPAEAQSVEARIRACRDADATGKGKAKGDLLITAEEAQAGYRITFHRYETALGPHPTPPAPETPAVAGSK